MKGVKTLYKLFHTLIHNQNTNQTKLFVLKMSVKKTEKPTVVS